VQYLLMCCFDEERWQAIPPPQQNRIMQDYGQFVESIVHSGHYLGGAKLQPSANAVTVRAANGKTVATDGPFAETKEHLGGYHLVECKDLDEAISIAARIPTIHVGGAVEVRALDPAWHCESTESAGELDSVPAAIGGRL
jgi:hypothetical protein